MTDVRIRRPFPRCRALIALPIALLIGVYATDARGQTLVTQAEAALYRVFLRDGGTLVSYGGMSGAPVTVGPVDLIFRDIRVRGFWQKHWLDATPRDEVAASYARLAPLVSDGTLYAPVAAAYPLERYQEAIAHAMDPGRAGKVLFAW